MNGISGAIYICYDDCSRAPTLHLDIYRNSRDISQLKLAAELNSCH